MAASAWDGRVCAWNVGASTGRGVVLRVRAGHGWAVVVASTSSDGGVCVGVCRRAYARRSVCWRAVVVGASTWDWYPRRSARSIPAVCCGGRVVMCASGGSLMEGVASLASQRCVCVFLHRLALKTLLLLFVRVLCELVLQLVGETHFE